MKLILTDLDGTLLHDDKSVSDYTLNVLKKLQNKGVLIGFSTGRGLKMIHQYIDMINPDVVICNAGADIYYKGELIRSTAFSNEETQKLLDRVYELCGNTVSITIDSCNEVYWNRGNVSAPYLIDAVYDDMHNFKGEAKKICVSTTENEVAKNIAAVLDSVDYLKFSDVSWYKFTPPNVNKENAIRYLSEKINIPVHEIISFGDDFSDIGMLKLCGKGIAVSNAIDEVLDIADEITKSNEEDGVAWFLENLEKNTAPEN